VGRGASLSYTPSSMTASCTPRRSLYNTLELRVGTYRIFYDVEEKSATVRVQAIGWKAHNRLFLRGKEYLLENR
jgi:hypothetical protein